MAGVHRHVGFAAGPAHRVHGFPERSRRHLAAAATAAAIAGRSLNPMPVLADALSRGVVARDGGLAVFSFVSKSVRLPSPLNI